MICLSWLRHLRPFLAGRFVPSSNFPFCVYLRPLSRHTDGVARAEYWGADLDHGTSDPLLERKPPWLPSPLAPFLIQE